MKPVLLMLLGYPGSGKSYFAKHLTEKAGVVRLNADSLRTRIHGGIEAGNAPEHKEALFGALDYAAQEVLRAGHAVVYDSQHRRRSDRRDTVALANEVGMPAVVVWLKTPQNVAIERLISRDSTHDQLQHTREEAEYRVAKADGSFEDFVDGETVIEIDGTADFEEQYKQLTDGLSQL